MKAVHIMSLLLTLTLALMLTSCGGGGGGALAGGGIDGSGIISVGTISAFGSIMVNGTVFDTGNAVIIVDGEEIGVGDDIIRANLDVGRVVTVEGIISEDGNDVAADRVIYNDNVKGPVERIRQLDAATREIVILGQTVIVNSVTKLKGTTFDGIALDDMVEVSGLIDDNGAIWATYFEKTGAFMPGVVVAVEGYVMNLDPVQRIFEINDLTVDYSQVDTSSLPGGTPSEDMLVEVEGRLDVAGGEMLAARIVPGDGLGVEDVGQIEITGFVTDFVSGSEFIVGNQVVRTDADTVFVDGIADDIAFGVKLEAEGSLIGGILFAAEIEFWGPDQIEVEGLVTNVGSASEFTVGEQQVQTDSETVFDGGTPADIAVGIMIEVKGSAAGSILVADKVSFE